MDADNLTTLFPDSQGFLSEFDTRVASKISPEYAAAFEAGIANCIAGDVLTWQAIRSGEWTKKEALKEAPLPFFWEFASGRRSDNGVRCSAAMTFPPWQAVERGNPWPEVDG